MFDVGTAIGSATFDYMQMSNNAQEIKNTT
jgi:hypothetical protein